MYAKCANAKAKRARRCPKRARQCANRARISAERARMCVKFALLARGPSDEYVCVWVHLAADCDNDDHCAGDLTCGVDNCEQYHGDALSSTTDCCTDGITTSTTTTTTLAPGTCKTDDHCTQGSDYFCSSQVCCLCSVCCRRYGR